MNNLEFKTIKIKNVFSISDEIVYDYTQGKGLTYVYGDNKDNPGSSNGVGKSSIFVNAILLALYGKTINNTQNSFIFNRNVSTKQTGYVELDLVKNGTTEYKIYINVKSNTRRDFCDIKVTLYKDGVDITKATKRDTFEYISSTIVGCAFDIFKNTIVISSSNLVNFFQMSQAIKKQYLQGILSLDNFSKAYDIANTKFVKLNNELKATSNVLQEKNMTLERTQKVYLQQEEERNVAVSKIDEDITNAEAELSRLKASSVVLENIEEKQQQVESISKVEATLQKVESYINNLQKVYNKTTKHISELESNNKILNNINELISEYNDTRAKKISKLENKLATLDGAESKTKKADIEKTIKSLQKYTPSQIIEYKETLKELEQAQNDYLVKQAEQNSNKELLGQFQTYICADCKKKLSKVFSVKDLDKSEQKVSKRLSDIEELKHIIDTQHKADLKINKYEKDLIAIDCDIASVEKHVNAINEDIAKLNEVDGKAYYNNQYKQAQANKGNLDKTSEELVSITNSIAQKLKVKSEITDVNEVKEQLSEIKASLVSKRDRYNKVLAEYNAIQQELREYELKQALQQENLKHINETIISLNARKESKLNEVNHFEQLIKDITEENKNIMAEIKSLSIQIKYLNMAREVFGEQGVKRFVIANIIDVLNNHIYVYLKKMGADFIVKFDDTLYYNFITPTGPCEYSSFSAGERRRLDLAVLLAFRNIMYGSSVTTNLCVVDEILDSAIDTSGLNSIIDILKDKAAESDQSIFVISHREGLAESSAFNHKILIEKQNNVTSLKQIF